MKCIKLILMAGVLALFGAGCMTSIDKGKQAMGDGDLAMAERHFSDALNTEDLYKKRDAYYYRGRVQEQRGQFGKAMQDYASAGATAPGSWQANVMEAQMALKVRDYSRAAKAADAALAVVDDNSDAIYVRGVCAVQMKDFELGKDHLESVRMKFASDREKGPDLLKNLAIANFHIQDFPAAYRYIRAFLSNKPLSGRKLLDDDYYWAGVIADVNLDDVSRDRYWKMVSGAYKKKMGIK